MHNHTRIGEAGDHHDTGLRSKHDSDGVDELGLDGSMLFEAFEGIEGVLS
jgi:hypothetical protein